MTVTLLDDRSALPTIFVPTTVQPAVMSVVAVLGSRPTKLAAGSVVAATSVIAIEASIIAEFLAQSMRRGICCVSSSNQIEDELHGRPLYWQQGWRPFVLR